MKCITYLILAILVVAVYSESCVELEVDIFEGLTSSLATGSILKYSDDGMLITARNSNGFQLFSFVPDRTPKLKAEKTFSNNTHYLHVRPFYFSGNEEAFYSVYNSEARNTSFFYTSGNINSLSTIRVGLDPRQSQFLRSIEKFHNSFFGITHTSIFRMDINILNEMDLTQINVPECEIPVSLDIITYAGVDHLLLLCSNNTQIPVVSYLFDFDFATQTFNVIDIPNLSTSVPIRYAEYQGFIYLSDGFSTWKTDLNGTTIDLKIGGRMIMLFGDLVLFSQLIVNEEHISMIRYSTLEDETILEVTRPIDHYFIYNNILYFGSDCGDTLREETLCKLDLTTLKVTHFNSFYAQAIQSFFIYNNEIFFVAHHETMGRELFYIHNNIPQIKEDIFRGSRSSTPSDITQLGDKYYMIAENIYYGREIFSIVQRSVCSSVGQIVYCDNIQCNITNSTGPVVFVGDFTVPNVTLTGSSTIEGNLFINGNLALGNSTSILGDFFVGQNNLFINSGSSVTVRGCVYAQHGTLVINVTDEELLSGNVSLLSGQCIMGSFKDVQVQSDNPCEKIQVTNTDTEQGLLVSFSTANVCIPGPSYDLVMIIPIVVVAALVLLVILAVLFVKPLREKVLPNRGRKDKARKTQTSSVRVDDAPKKKRGMA